jgi:hypothetical protein
LKDKGDSGIRIRANRADVTSDPAPAAPHRPAQPRRQSYQYYLEDRPVLVPIIMIAVCTVCVFSTVVTHVLRDWLLGATPSTAELGNYNMAMSWLVAFAFAGIFLSIIFLLLHGGSRLIHRLRQRPAVCPRCGAGEAGSTLRFRRAPVEGTVWEEITCAQCGHAWYGRT